MIKNMKNNLGISPKKEHFRQLSIGIVILLLARLALACVVLLSRFATKSVSMPEMIFFQNAIALICLLPFFFKFGLKSLKMENVWHVLIRIISGLLAFVFLLLSAQQISLTGSILLNNAAPLYVPFVALIWRKVPINHRLWTGIILGFIGLIFILEPWKVLSGVSVFKMELGFLYGLLSGICAAIAIISMRVLRFSRMFPILFFYYLFSCVVTLPPALMEWTMPPFSVVWILLAIGVLTLITQGGYLKAFRYGQAAHLSPFFYVAVVYGALFDWLVFHHLPDLWMILGTVFLIVGGIWIILFSNSHKQG